MNSCTTYLLPKFHRHKLDPIGFGGGDDNLYRYVGNSTPNLRDPSGLSAQETAEASGDDEGPVFLDPADDTTSEMVQEGLTPDAYTGNGPIVKMENGEYGVYLGKTIGGNDIYQLPDAVPVQPTADASDAAPPGLSPELIQDRLAFFNKYMSMPMSVAEASAHAQEAVAEAAGARVSKYKIAMQLGGPELAVQNEAYFNQLVKSASSILDPNATIRAIQEERARNSGAIATGINVFGRYAAGSMLKIASYNMDAQGSALLATVDKQIALEGAEHPVVGGMAAVAGAVEDPLAKFGGQGLAKSISGGLPWLAGIVRGGSREAGAATEGAFDAAASRPLGFAEGGNAAVPGTQGGFAVNAVAESEGIVAQNGTTITGFTKHGVDRAVGDAAQRAGTRPEAILDALKSPEKIVSGVDSQARPFEKFIGQNAQVVVNPQTGKIVSVNPLSGAGAH